MTEKRMDLLWRIVNEQVHGITSGEDAEYVAEQWACEVMLDMSGRGEEFAGC